jgi:hypothetical protein
MLRTRNLAVISAARARDRSAASRSYRERRRAFQVLSVDAAAPGRDEQPYLETDPAQWADEKMTLFSPFDWDADIDPGHYCAARKLLNRRKLITKSNAPMTKIVKDASQTIARPAPRNKIASVNAAKGCTD